MSTKIRYEIDPYNRLVLVDKDSAFLKQRRVLEGRFVIRKGNSLEYQVKSPLSESEKTPYLVRLKGAWSLSANHNFILSMKRSSGGASGDALIISGNIIDAKGDAILFSVTTKRGNDTANTYVLEITGSWALDRKNRLIFKVKRDSGIYDPLLFEAAWEVNKNNDIAYRYEKSHLKTKLKIIHTLILKGQWKMGQKGSLNYEFNATSGNALRFDASICGCGKDYVKYEVGAMLSERVKPKKRTIMIYGVWRFKKGAGLFFDIESSDGNINSISFTAEARLTARDTILFSLKNDIGGKDIGVRFELNHDLLKGDGSAFIRILRSLKESSVMMGAGFRW